MKNVAYTLPELAHFDRCIFPGDFAESLVEHGVEEVRAGMVARWIAERGNRDGAVSIWQHWGRKMPEIESAIEAMLADFAVKYWRK